MNNNKNHSSSSRSTTPWTDDVDASELQKLIDAKNSELYSNRHPELITSGEVVVLNKYIPSECPFCHSKQFIKVGYDKNKIQRYLCKCHDVHQENKSFTVLTNTIFDKHKIPLTEWVDFCLSLFRQESYNAISKGKRNSINTTKYWTEKIFLLLRDYPKHIILENNVYLDETFYRVEKKDLKQKNGRSDARNKYCIGIACDDKHHVYCAYERMAGTSNAATYRTFKSHIKKGSTIIHDKTVFHDRLIEKLKLTSKAYLSKDLITLKDKDNPLYPVNKCCNNLKILLKHHTGFKRSQIYDYLNLFCFIYNTPQDPFEKVEIILEMALKKHIVYRYRDKFPTVK